MLSTLIASARAHPRTTLAGVAAVLSLLGGALGVVHTGQWWPGAAGGICFLIAHIIQAGLQADAASPGDAAAIEAAVVKVLADFAAAQGKAAPIGGKVDDETVKKIAEAMSKLGKEDAS